MRIYTNGTRQQDRHGSSNDDGNEGEANTETCDIETHEDEEEVDEEPILFCKQGFTCGMAIENAYYPSIKDNTRGGGVVTNHICFN